MAGSPPTITKREVMTLLGLKFEAELARWYGISKGAVSHWGGLDDPIPRARYLELRYERRPDLFAPGSIDVETADAQG